jgi:hypothetical protein
MVVLVDKLGGEKRTFFSPKILTANSLLSRRGNESKTYLSHPLTTTN